MNAMPKSEDAIPNDLKATPEACSELTYAGHKKIVHITIEVTLRVVQWWNQLLSEHQLPHLQREYVNTLLLSSLDRVEELKSFDIGDQPEKRIIEIVREQFMLILRSLPLTESLRDIK